MRSMIAAALWLVLGTALPEAYAHQASEHGPAGGEIRPVAALSSEDKAREYFTDRVLVTQDGTEVRFFSDVLRGKVVLVNMLFTSCTDACPLISHQLAAVQNLLGDTLDSPFRLVSLTVDPARDTPEVLREYAERFGAMDGWLFLTGTEENVSAVTGRLGHVDPDFRNHLTYLMLGNVSEGRWIKVPANLPPELIAAQLRLLAGS